MVPARVSVANMTGNIVFAPFAPACTEGTLSRIGSPCRVS